MKIKTLLAGLILTSIFLLSGILVGAYFTSPSFLVKESQTSLLIDNNLVLNRDGSKGAHVSVIGHSYSQPGILEFVSRVYRFVPGYYFEFDASDITSMSSKSVYFINRSRSDEASPVAATFTVQWKIEGKEKNKTKIIDSREFRGSAIDTAHGFLPVEMQDFSKEIIGKDKINLNFTQLDLEFADEGEGEYSLEMSGVINYTFLPWSGYIISNKSYTVFFKANVSYSNGTHTRIKLYYPANFFTENVRITHPVLVKLKKILGRL